MQAHSGDCERGGEIRLACVAQPDFAKQIHDGGGRDERRISQRQIACGADKLLKLAGYAAAFALVITVVRAWREFVDQKLTLLRYKDFDAQQAFEVETCNDRLSQRLCARFKLRWNAGRKHAPRQDLILVMIARGGIAPHFSR